MKTRIPVRLFLILPTIIFLTIMAGPAPAAAGADYKVIRTWKLGGDGGWDYLTADSAGHRLFIARATRVMVIDIESGKQVGEIPDTPGVHGVALDYELGRGFTSNGREDTVSVAVAHNAWSSGAAIVVRNNSVLLTQAIENIGALRL